jgi:hypothetical protein
MRAIFTCELMIDGKAQQRSFATRREAGNWAVERLNDEQVASVAVWRVALAMSPADAVLALVDGSKAWRADRALVRVVKRAKKPA